MAFLYTNNELLKRESFLAGVDQLIGVSSHAPKCCWFYSYSGHIPDLWLQSLIGGSQLMFPLYIDVSLGLPSSLSQTNKNIYSDEDFKKRKERETMKTIPFTIAFFFQKEKIPRNKFNQGSQLPTCIEERN